MKSLRFSSLFILVISLSGGSCSERKQLAERRDKQAAEITRLKAELEVINAKLEKMPPDVSNKLVEATQIFEKQSAEVRALEAEVTKLDARKSALQSEFSSYQTKYPIK
jgi:chromosome segregation ATPase